MRGCRWLFNNRKPSVLDLICNLYRAHKRKSKRKPVARKRKTGRR